uniref:Uncharacterized protein n=1 Tax=Pelusios castaneus TaxID=367368 RepID=A0A8C8SH83_9SAUR
SEPHCPCSSVRIPDRCKGRGSPGARPAPSYLQSFARNRRRCKIRGSPGVCPTTPPSFPLLCPSSWCRRRASPSANRWPHSWQTWGRSSMWMRSWVMRLELWLKALPHSPHRYGFSPVWVRWCWMRWELRTKLFPHSEHWYGFSPVWIRCAARSIKPLPQLEFWLKPRPHSGQMKGFSPV